MITRHWLALSAILAATTAIYLAAGLAGAYVAADDFQWLGSGHTFTWDRLLYVTGGNRFYRPVADLWFAASTKACGFALPCHHLLLLAVHLANVALVFTLAVRLFDSLRTAWLATLLFALQPAYAQAVVWLSAITGVFCAFGYLASLAAISSSWRASDDRQRHARELLAVVLFMLAAFSHEAAITLPVTAAVMWRLFGPPGAAGRRLLIYGMAAVVVAFAAATLLANRSNALFEDSGYRIGTHAIGHALGYVASLYVGPNSAAAHIVIVVAVGALILINRATRFGALWMLITMLPYLPFTAPNTSRYAYLPSIGFAWAVAAAIVAGADRLRRAPRAPAWTPALVYGVAAVFVTVRFAPFALASARGQVRSFEAWRARAQEIAGSAEARDGTIHVTDPRDPLIHQMYVEPIVRWERQDYESAVSSR